MISSLTLSLSDGRSVISVKSLVEFDFEMRSSGLYGTPVVVMVVVERLELF